MVKNDWKVALTYVGAIVGAGFASGQELTRFFVVFGGWGLLGIIIAGCIFAILGAVVIDITNRVGSNDYGQFLSYLFPVKFKMIVDIIIAFSLWIGLAVMLTGSATLLEEKFALKSEFGFIITGLLVFFCLQFGSSGLLNANSILVPVMVVFAVGSSLIYILNPVPCLSSEIFYWNLLPNWWSASFIYVGYNMILGMVVLASVKDDNKKITPWGGVWGGVILGIMSFIMVRALQLLPGNLLISEMPMLALTRSINPVVGNIYLISLWIAIFTTALATAHSLTARINHNLHKPYRLILAFSLLSTLVFIPWKFSTLVGLIYPLEGYLAIPIILAVIIAAVRLRS